MDSADLDVQESCRVIRAGNTLQTSVYRKPTSTDRLLDNSSYHPASHKSATIKTLVKRAHVVCSSSEDLKTELQHLNEIFDVNQIKSNQFIHYIHTYTNISNLGIIISSKVAQRETKRLLRFGLLS